MAPSPEDPEIRVAVLEFGSDRSIFVQIRRRRPSYTQDKFNWGYWSDPSRAGRPGHGLPARQGAGWFVGINGMALVRGCAGDLDQWEEVGARPNYACCPYYQRLERTGFARTATAAGGEVGVGTGNDRLLNPYDAFIAAGEQAGYPVTEDYNGFRRRALAPCR